MTQEETTELKALINEELKTCEPLFWPHVCSMKSTERGLERLHEMIIHNINEGMRIDSAIAHIEHELSYVD